MGRKVGLTESKTFSCLEGLEETNDYASVSAISLDYCGWEKCPSSFQFGPYVRDSFVIHIILDGKGHYKTDKGEFELKKGDAFLIEPGVETVYQADKDDPWHYTWVGFHGLRAKSLTEKMGFTEEKPVVSVKQLDSMRDCIQRMINASRITIINEMRRMSELMYLFSLFCEDNDSYVESVEQRDYPSDVYVSAAVDYMMAHFKDKIKIDDLADSIGITRSYLTNSFKKKMGISPQKFLIDLRLEKACEMLKETNEAINIIALQCGYEDSLSFSKAFKVKYNMSPKQYRESKIEVKINNSKQEGIDNYPL